MGIQLSTLQHTTNLIMKTTTLLSVLLLCSAICAAPATVDDEDEVVSLEKNNVIDATINKTIEALANVLNAPEEALTIAQETFREMGQFIQAAQDNIYEIYAELALIQEKGFNATIDYLNQFDSVKNDLRISRQELRKLAYTTVVKSKDLKTLMTALDETSDTVLLGATITEMKNLLMKSQKILAKADVGYKNAIVIMDKMESDMRKQILELEKISDENSQEYQVFQAKVRSSTYGSCAGVAVGMAIADVFGCLGVCSATVTTTCFAVGAGASEGSLATWREALDEFRGKCEGLQAGIAGMEETTQRAQDILAKELAIIHEWEQASEDLSDKIEQYPAKYLQKYQAIKTIFVRSVDGLRTAAESFLAQPISFFGNNVDDEKYV